MDNFIRRHNIKHFKRQIAETKDDDRRKMLEKLLAEEVQKQVEAGDLDNSADKQFE